MPAIEVDCYDYPQYWDLAFRSETKTEADFFEAVAEKYSRVPVNRLMEPGCGGGRLVVEMSSRGYEVTGIDLNLPSVQYVRRRLKRRQLIANVTQADMTSHVIQRPVDLAFNTFNTFRHLTTEESAREHLLTMAENVRPGGIYILGFHLLPPDADEEDCERWTARHAQTKVTVTLRVLECDRVKRLEKLRFNLLVRTGEQVRRFRSDYLYRIYTAEDVYTLLESVPQWELCDVFDFWYDLDEPLDLDNELGDTVLVLRRK